MDSATLKNIQAPLKQQYRDDPDAAFITLKAQGSTGEGISCSVETGKAIVAAGLHKATGGNGMLVCSGDMLLEALVACAGVTLNAVATALELNIVKCIIKAEGDLDFRGTLGVDKEVQVGFKSIRLVFEMETDSTQQQIDTLLKLTERYCVVYQTLRSGTPLTAAIVKSV